MPDGILTAVFESAFYKAVQSIYKGFVAGSAPFDPASLFTGGYTGGYYDASDLSTLWQDSARTTPVTADGDPVGAWDDKSGNGNHLTQATSGRRPLYKTSGGLHWLQFDGIDDSLATSGTVDFSASDKLSILAGVYRNSGTSTLVSCGNTASEAGSFDLGPFGTGVVLYRRGSGSFGAQEIAMTSSAAHVLTATLDLSGTTHATEITAFRRDTTSPSRTNYGNTDSGSGNFGNRALIVGTGKGNLNGRMYQLVVVGKTVSGTEITDTEASINTKCGAY